MNDLFDNPFKLSEYSTLSSD